MECRGRVALTRGKRHSPSLASLTGHRTFTGTGAVKSFEAES